MQTTRSEQTGAAGPLGAATSTQMVTICPRCARRREVRGWLIGGALALFVLGGLAIFIFEVVLRR